MRNWSAIDALLAFSPASWAEVMLASDYVVLRAASLSGRRCSNFDCFKPQASIAEARVTAALARVTQAAFKPER